MKNIIFFVAVILILLGHSGLALAQLPVKIDEQQLVIPTYKIAPAELNPIFYTGRNYQGAQGHIYPYPISDKLTDDLTDVYYNAVYIENEYTKICVLPELGGRLFQAIDKTDNFNFFYKQNVIKPSLIGMLGAWISGGVEWNIPHHHRASTFMPVDYTTTENKDGSKTVWVGETELRNRLKWSVGLSLVPGRSYIEATIRIVNPTPFAQSFLYWANVSVHSSKDYQVIFPPSTQYGVGHAKNQFIDWPVGKDKYGYTDFTGVDVSWWKNHPTPNSIFAWNFKDDFLAGYDHGLKAGTVHVANHHIVGGKKFFLWGNNEQSLMWDKILTEKDGPYTELMVGAYSNNQPDYSWIAPGEVREFKQFWYPISKLEGVKCANTDVAVNLEIKDNQALIGFQTTGLYEGAKVRLTVSDKIVFEQNVNLNPAKPFVTNVTLPANTSQYNVEVSLVDASGKSVISYKPVENPKMDMPKPVEPPKNPKEYKSVEELYYTGLRLEQFYNATIDPMIYYNEAISRDSSDYRTNTILGVHYLKNGNNTTAERYLRRAIKRITLNYTTPKDGEAFYYLGTLLKYDNRFEEAIDYLYKATWFTGFQSQSFKALSEIECYRGNFPEALRHIDQSINTNGGNQKLIAIKAGILRRTGASKEAISLLANIQHKDLLDFHTKFEQYLNLPEAGVEAVASLSEFKKSTRGIAQTYLELASEYEACGMWSEGSKLLRLLTDANMPESKNPELYYYLGYFAKQLGNTTEAATWYAKGSSMPVDYCFPSRIESMNVLKTGQILLPADPRIAYYLGELYCYFRQFDLAIESWKSAVTNDSGFSMAYRNLGFAYSKYKNDNLEAIASYEKAFALNNVDSRLLFELDELYKVTNVDPAKRLKTLIKQLQTVEKRDETLANLLQLYIYQGEYDKALSYLNKRHFHVWEGGGDIHDIYRDACLLQGIKYLKSNKFHEALADFKKADLFPDNLEVGRSVWDFRSAQIYYYTGLAYEALNKKEEALTMFNKVIDLPLMEQSDFIYFKALSLEKTGKKKEAAEIYQRMEKYYSAKISNDENPDFFEKFGAETAQDIRNARVQYLLGLANLGKGDKINAKSHFELALKFNVNHVWAALFLKETNMKK